MEGKILGLKVDNEFAQCEIDCTLNFEQEQLATSGMDAGWRDHIGGYKGWSVDLNSRLTVGAMLVIQIKLLIDLSMKKMQSLNYGLVLVMVRKMLTFI